MNQPIVSVVLFVVGAVLLPAKIFAVEPAVIEEAHLVIDFGTLQPNKESSWEAACKALGRAMTIGNGLWGSGIFTSVTCIKKNGKVSGRAPDGGHKTWRLTFRASGGSLVAAMKDPVSDEAATVTKFGVTQDLAALLSDPEISGLFALAVLDSTPLLLRISKDDVELYKDKTGTLKRSYLPPSMGIEKPAFSAAEAPDELSLYSLVWDPKFKLWRPKLVGEALRIKVVKGVATYALDESAAQSIAQGPVWAHSGEGRGARTKEFVDRSNAAMNAVQSYQSNSATQRFAQALRDTTSSGYLGIRYGLQLTKDDPLISKTNFFGLLAEVRGGPVAGLRYYYDKLPKKTLDEQGSKGESFTTYIGWARHLLGYSISFYPGMIIDEISLTPKLGVWNFDSTTVVDRNAAGLANSVQRFQVDRALGLGIELGVETRSRWYSLRPWVGYERAVPLIKNSASISSTRVGLDAFLLIGPKFTLWGDHFRTAFLLFCIGESAVLRDPSAVTSSDATGTIEGFEYSAAYAGAGIAISW